MVFAKMATNIMAFSVSWNKYSVILQTIILFYDTVSVLRKAVIRILRPDVSGSGSEIKLKLTPMKLLDKYN